MDTQSTLRRRPEPRRRRRGFVAPDVLRREHILGDPADPVDACRRARALLRQGELTAARALLTPHTRGPRTNVVALELLAAVAVTAGASDAPTLLGRARSAHELRGDDVGLARVELLEAERDGDGGELHRAHSRLDHAAPVLTAADDRAALARIEHLRAELRLVAGDLHDALDACDVALAVVAGPASHRLEARLRLTRGQVLAALGRPALATRELVTAAEVFGASASPTDRVSLRLARAESLRLMGVPRRAADGLRRVLDEALDLDAMRLLARVHAALGEALLESDPAGARQQLMRARHLHEGGGLGLGVALCDIALARAERRLGLDVRRRLEALPAALLADSPRLAALAHIARAELLAPTDPDRACVELRAARDHASSRDNVSLILETTRVHAVIAPASCPTAISPHDSTLDGSSHRGR